MSRPVIPSQRQRVLASMSSGAGRDASGPLRHHPTDVDLLRIEADGAWKIIERLTAENADLRTRRAAA